MVKEVLWKKRKLHRNSYPSLPATVENSHLENIGQYHNFRQLWLFLGVRLMEINSNLFSRQFVQWSCINPLAKTQPSCGKSIRFFLLDLFQQRESPPKCPKHSGWGFFFLLQILPMLFFGENLCANCVFFGAFGPPTVDLGPGPGLSFSSTFRWESCEMGPGGVRVRTFTKDVKMGWKSIVTSKGSQPGWSFSLNGPVAVRVATRPVGVGWFCSFSSF